MDKNEQTTPAHDAQNVPQTIAAPLTVQTDVLPDEHKMNEKKIDRKKKDQQSGIEDPHKIIRTGLFLIFFFFGVLGAWAAIGEIKGAVVAPGKIKIETERKTVQHLEGGIVEEILVREGDEVKAGEPLIVLESIQVDSSVAALLQQLVASVAAHARFLAEKDMQENVVWPEGLEKMAAEANAQEALSNELKLFTARHDAVQGQVSLLKSQKQQINAQISGLNEQYRAENAIIETLKEELEAKRALFEERYLEKSQILELERLLASHQGTRGQLRQNIAESRQRHDETTLKMDDVINRFIEDASTNIARLDSEIAQIQEKLRPLRDAKTRLNIVAPVSGRVVDLKVHSKGGVIRSGEELMDIVPADNPLIVEVQVPVNKITEVYLDQEAKVQLDAFDLRVTPLIAAKVVYISADRLEEQTATGTMPYYLCHVEVSQEAIDDAEVYLSPGMPATVFITTRSQTVLGYIAEPIIKNWELALRE